MKTSLPYTIIKEKQSIADCFGTLYARIIIILLLICTANNAGAQIYDKKYKEWLKKPSRELIDIGGRYAEVSGKPDSALICFTIVASRYSQKAPEEEQRLSLIAYIGKWYLYFFHYFDYAKSFENLSKAREISWRIGKEKARVMLNFGCMYQTLAEQNDNRDLNRKAYNYYRDAFRIGLKQNDASSMFKAFGNLVTVAFSLDSLQSITEDYKAFAKLKGDATYAYDKMLYKGLKDVEDRHYAEALSVFEQQYTSVKDLAGYERFRFVSVLNQARALAGMKRYDEAISRLRKLEQSVVAMDMKDAKLEVYKTLADYYKASGEEQSSLQYRDRYFCLKDTLFNYQQVAKVSELHFLDEMKQLDEQLSQMNHERQVQTTITLIILFVAIMFAVFLLVIYGKNKQLRKKNKLLYEKSLENIERSITPSPSQQKYQNSTLSEEEKEKIFKRVLDVMDNSEEIYSPDFNVDRLAQLTETRSKYVSQVINEKYNDNFNSLINKYRIREACRRLSDTEHFGQYTIDAISKSVGFRSRNTFSVGFRRFTGLTPSEYQRIAKESGSPES